MVKLIFGIAVGMLIAWNFRPEQPEFIEPIWNQIESFWSSLF